MFCNPNVTLLSLDPYNNTFGEKNWLIILLVVFSCLYCTFGMVLAFGIILFEKYGLNPGNRQLVDTVRFLLSFINSLISSKFKIYVIFVLGYSSFGFGLNFYTFAAPVIFNGDGDNSIWTRNVSPISSKCDWTIGKY